MMGPEEFTLYEERAVLTAVIAQLFGGVLSYSDPLHPDWAVLYIETPEGQLSWHISAHDLREYGAIKVVPDYPWDGHTTPEKYRRLRKLIPQLPKLTYDNPVYGRP